MKLNPESPLFRGLTKVFDAVFITLLWALFTLPVVTAGAAASAMYASMLALAEGRGGGAAPRFLCSFRENWKVSTLVWLPYLALGAVLAADIAACWMAATPANRFWQMLRGLTLCGGVVYLCLLPYLFAGAGRFVVTVRQTWRNALVMAAGHPGASLGMALLTGAMTVSWVLLLVFALPVTALGLYLQARVLSRIFNSYIPDGKAAAEAD